MAKCVKLAAANVARIVATAVAILFAGCAGAPTTVNLPGDETDPGRGVYIAKCAKCHKFYDPAKYSPGDWAVWMQKMSRKAKLTPEQAKEVSDYIDLNLRPGKGAP